MGIRGCREEAARGNRLLVGPAARPFGRGRQLRLRGAGREERQPREMPDRTAMAGF
jgi:hypothetical protein